MSGLVWLLVSCAAEIPAKPPHLALVTPQPALTSLDVAALCQHIDAQWERNWEAVLEALSRLDQIVSESEACTPAINLADRQYTAYLAYGDWLLENGDSEAANAAYLAAGRYRFDDPTVNARLASLEIDTSPALLTCDSDAVAAALNQMLAYIPSTTDAFVQVQEDQFVLSGSTYPVFGINYTPRDFPAERFLREAYIPDLTFELELIRSAGFNLLRIELRHSDLFQCPGNGAIPVMAVFTRLDAFIQAAAAHDLRVLLVLNADWQASQIPVYNDWPLADWQMRYIAQRYQFERAVLGYDLRPRGDDDYMHGENSTREQVLNWLLRAAQIVRADAPNHLITAGWDNEAEVTAPVVDFVSFQHFGDLVTLRQEIAVLQANTNRPIVLAAFGYSTAEMDLQTQQYQYLQTLEAAQRNGLAGWIAWTAFDFTPATLCTAEDDRCLATLTRDSQYGLWAVSYFPKPALRVVQQMIATAAD